MRKWSLEGDVRNESLRTLSIGLAAWVLGLGIALAHVDAAVASGVVESGSPIAPSDVRNDISDLVPIDRLRNVYLECIGSGSPTVVLISGGFEAGWIWKYALYSTDLVLEAPTDDFSAGRGDPQRLGRAVFPTTGGLTRVCNYDRPNTTLGSAAQEERGGKVSSPVRCDPGGRRGRAQRVHVHPVRRDSPEDRAVDHASGLQRTPLSPGARRNFERAEKDKGLCDARTTPCLLVGRVGIEPTTNGLRVRCSTS